MKESFHVYLNLDVVNNSTNVEQPLIFSETRTIPFLTNSENYFLTVARFTLQTANSLPVFIPDILLGQSDPKKTVYQIAMSILAPPASSIVRTVYISYTTTDQTLKTPDPPLSTVDNSTTYYWVYNVSDWVSMINKAFLVLTSDIIAAGVAEFNAPFLQYDVVTGLFSLSVDENAVSNHGLTVAFNARLYNLLPFPATLIRNSLFQSLDDTYAINLSASLATQATLLVEGTRADFLTTTTEFSPLPLMNPIRNIYFTTSQIPIQPTLSQPPKVFNDTNLTATNSGAPDITNILTDFEVSVTATNNYNGEIIYLPQNEYRLVDLNEGFNLNKIDINCFWKDKFNREHQIYLPVGCCANLKLLFRHKRFFSGLD